MTHMECIEIDGTQGGGQILRFALGFSAALGKPFRMVHIRKNRSSPGLAAQHLACVHAVQELCGAHVEGDQIGSTTLTFTPKKIKKASLDIDVGTAGSLNLLLQSLMIPALCMEKSLRIRCVGGTDVAFSIPSDFMCLVILPALSPYLQVQYSLQKRGYYPKGGGKIEVKIKNTGQRFPIERTHPLTLLRILGVSHASKDLLDAHVAQRQAQYAELLLKPLRVPVALRIEYSDTLCTGSGITLCAQLGDPLHRSEQQCSIGADVLGERGKKANVVGEEAAKKLLALLKNKAILDEHLADNLIPFLGLMGGSIQAPAITDHIRAGIFVTEQFLGKCFTIEDTLIRVETPFFSSSTLGEE